MKIVWSEVVEYRDGKIFWKINTFSGRYKNHPAAVKGNEIGTKKKGGYYHFSYQGKNYQRHEIIWILHNGDIPEGFVIDHIKPLAETGFSADDRIENLRLLDRGSNASKGSNIPNVSNKTSNRRGVSWDSKYSAKPWRARMKIGDKVLCENFACFEDACAKRLEWEMLRYGK